MLEKSLRAIQFAAGHFRTRCANLPLSRLSCWTEGDELPCIWLSSDMLGVVVKLPLAQFALILERTSCCGFLQGTNPAKQTSSPSLMKWWRAIEHGDCPNCPFPLACEAELQSWLFVAIMTSYKNIQFRSSLKLLMPSCTKVFMFLPSSTDWLLVHFQLELETAVNCEAAAEL